MLINNKLRTLIAATLLTGAISASARADDDEDHRPFAKNKVWQSECGECHVAYPPGMLPAASWRVLMSGLNKHFGSDASLDKATAREISDFLEKNAGRRRHESTPLLRITETRWFIHEHDEIAERTWKNPRIKSPANCAACHPGAESGNFNEHNIRIPK
jgi:nitrate/TMAO reductase-like tetraheme cytochrome c subunit